MIMDQAYYLATHNEQENVCRRDTELVINCCGLVYQKNYFRNNTPNGREDFYLQYMIEGEMDMFIQRTQQVIASGQAIIHYPHTPYRYATRNNTTVHYLWLHFSGSNAYKIVNDYNFPNQTIMDVDICQNIIHSFDSLFHEFVIRDKHFNYLNSSKLISILTDISMSVGKYNDIIFRNRLFRSISYIHKNLSSDISINDLAEMEHLSLSRYRSLFREVVGLSPLSYIMNIRVAHAKEMLILTDRSVAEVAFACGYKDPLYFCRVFKKLAGCSPMAFRIGTLSSGLPKSSVEVNKINAKPLQQETRLENAIKESSQLESKYRAYVK